MSTTSDVQSADPSSDALDAQIERANASGRTPVVFVHGLWLLPSSWRRWAAMFEEAGYPTVLPGWPDDPATVDEARELLGIAAHEPAA